MTEGGAARLGRSSPLTSPKQHSQIVLIVFYKSISVLKQIPILLQ